MQKESTMAAALKILPLGVIFALGGCVAVPPTGTTTVAMPGTGKDLAAFQQDDAICREYGLAPGSHDYAICRDKKRHERALTERETDYGFLQNPLTPDVTVGAPTPR